MSEDNTSTKTANLREITLADFAEMVRQLRHNQRRYQYNPTPEKLATLEYWEKEVDAVVAFLTDTQLKLFG